MASLPSLLKMRMLKSASGMGLGEMSMSPSLPIPKWGRLHSMLVLEGSGISPLGVYT